MWLVPSVFLVPLLYEIFYKIGFFNESSVNSTERSQLEYSSSETAALLQLRAQADIANILPQVHPYFRKDHVLIRYLRARNLDVTKAAQMYTDAIKFRTDHRLDFISNETILNFRSPPYTFDGYDYEGRPVIYFTLAPYDLKKLLIAGKRNEVLRSLVQFIEYGVVILRNHSIDGKLSPSGKEITQGVVIMDVGSFSLSKHFCIKCPAIFMELIKIMDTYYPDSLKYVVIINVFRSWVPLLETFTRVLAPATKRALKIYGPHKAEWSKFLLSIIPADQLLVSYGGNKV